MDNDIVRTILPMLSRESILHVHNVVGSEPISFAMLRHEIVKQMIEEGLKEEMHDDEIARKAGVCKRTVERYKRNKLLRYRNINQTSATSLSSFANAKPNKAITSKLHP